MFRLMCFALLIVSSFAVLANCDRIKVNGEHNWFDVSYRVNSHAPLQGLAVDLANRVFAEVGIEVDYQAMVPWKRQFLQLETGDLDVIIAAFYNQQRGNKFVYSEAIGVEYSTAFIHKEHSDTYRGAESLVGKRGLQLLGSSFGDQFDSYAKQNLTISKMADLDRAIKLIALKRADYFLYATHGGRLKIAETEFADMLVDMQPSISKQQIFMVMSKSSPCLAHLDEINRAIRRHRDDF
ncbi:MULTISPECIES: substrate-binding periplasmic protein [unclassified Agarivorans]|uniref:substrate-binding periplasmic protein n=1 Tax=unclassified Agarivorans TaxID=2636026 RepID=UPI0026E42895|nr:MULTISPECIES: transporter substrate-binding domain-containing protein [unclassified Agarivorans]MDO6683973.1 transporter substrate-binding domain-containing protein [Agarivorans sp. 3_MG-2023]MDO6714294.1 transporter substrate-binding domain-containing protein [Agarivorans sp. 2_MG-2023]